MQNNRVELAGYLASKPVVRRMPSGATVANVRLGETYRFSDRSGNWHKQTNWHNLSFYDPLAISAAKFEKGDNLFVEGRIQQRKFTPSDGVTRTLYEIVVRSCHLVADSGSTSGDLLEQSADSQACQTGELLKEEKTDETWPIG